MTKIMSEAPCILALVSELVSRRVPQHMRMNWKRKPFRIPSLLFDAHSRCFARVRA
jgi:hypothetical protein